MRIFHNLHIDFMSKRRMFYGLSGLIILIGIISMVMKGLTYGIDFKGGTEVIVRFQQAEPIEKVRSVMDAAKSGTFEIKTFGSQRDYMIRTDRKGEGAKISTAIKDALAKGFQGERIEILAENRVEAKIGSEIRRDSIIALFLSLIGILIYLGFRFKFVFAYGAVIALFHDVLLTLGLVSIFDGVIPGLNLEMSQALLAAFLTLIGFSVNDTVVVFDRVRENLKLFKTQNFIDILNKSMNTTMSRTILTSFTVFIACIALLFFGGEPTRGFAFVMAIGVVTGTYSSIFVASALTADWVEKRGTKITF